MKGRRKKGEIVCRIQRPPNGCPGLFPPSLCTNPSIILDNPGPISCEATITGRVICDLVPVSGVTVQLTSSFAGVIFEDDTPVTDNRGRFTTIATVARNTPIQQGVIISASATVIGIEVSDSITTSAGCIACRNPRITLITPQGVVGCSGGQLTGVVTCDNVPVPNASVSFFVSDPRSIILEENPTTTNANGEYSIDFAPVFGITETVTISARAAIGGTTVETDPQSVELNCHTCVNPAIDLFNPGQISCSGLIRGRVTCNGLSVPNTIVNLRGSSILRFADDNPRTGVDGIFETPVTIRVGTEIQDVEINASAIVNGRFVEDTEFTRAGCLECRNPLLTILTPAGTVTCNGAPITGRVTCDGEGIENVTVSFRVESSAGPVFVLPDVTDAEGFYSTRITPGFGAVGNVTVTAFTTVGGIPIESPAQVVTVDCPGCRIQLDNPGPISCEALITGRVLCGQNEPQPGITVTLSTPAGSPLIFDDENPETDANGVFSSIVRVRFPTSQTDGLEYTATAEVNGDIISNTNRVRAGCIACENPLLTLNVPGGVIGCDGALLTGRLSCEGEGLPNFAVFIDIISGAQDVFFIENPAITGPDGSFSSRILPAQGATGTRTIRARAEVAGQEFQSVSRIINVNCPPSECPCKFNLNTQGGAQPGARIRVTRFGVPSDLIGQMNINVSQCGSSQSGGCNPANDSFNFTFNALNGDNYQFSQGRRRFISCSNDGRSATVVGDMLGRVNNGPFRDFEVTITVTLDPVTKVAEWQILATDGTATRFETIVPWRAQASPQSFIADCE
ncbi:hypothetical protein BK139_01765 [Paenibacillus sp. FSL R5-0490]|uniref:hypothetical protein n=1 Tax=Paenibacillus sp. FSL R5-0490 TaxID=1920424 RepID=UPI00096D6379|nr:hypothetical protein [Paenibacillus sp. FSL R5-0490]OMF63416.1 hypothetical protein BK139_01765 [Paenibacillus sp. FSL R5-0490]